MSETEDYCPQLDATPPSEPTKAELIVQLYTENCRLKRQVKALLLAVPCTCKACPECEPCERCQALAEMQSSPEQPSSP